MCGIIGYTGHRPAVPLVIDGLRLLEYRGYDSSGVAFMQGNTLQSVKAKGKLIALEDKLADIASNTSTVAVGHTRWATHGVPATRNAHPHKDNSGKLAMVHNGIIENYQELKDELLAKGYVFNSETDTEVLVNLIAEEFKQYDDLLEAFACALRKAHGAYAVCLFSEDEPNTLYAARLAAPLILGIGTGENFVASDIPAFLSYTRQVVFLDDGEVVKLTPKSWEVLSLENLQSLEKNIDHINWDMQSAQKGGYKHFMLKEIFEQPAVLRDGMTGRFANDQVYLPELENLHIPKRLYIVGCGTSYNSGLWAKSLLESWAKIAVSVEIASEFRYGEVLCDPDDMVLVLSQSGETADTLAALRVVKEKNIPTLGMCNVVGSSIAREASATIYTQAGPEISVASTKAMCSQMLLLTLMALHWALRKKSISSEKYNEIVKELQSIPNTLDNSLADMRSTAQHLSREYTKYNDFFYLGRGHAFALALEGALKLKELSYIHAEGYACGEMKHGPIALIAPEFPTFAIAFDDVLFPKVKSNIVEVQARSGKVIALVNGALGRSELQVDFLWNIPYADGFLAAFYALPALQLFSYEMADYLGTDVDQPRNLAKSVTVE